MPRPETSRQRTLSGPLPSGRGYSRSEVSGGESLVNRLADAVDRAFELTLGQPALVNALARQIVEILAPDRSQAITRAHVDKASVILIERQDTHLDNLVERLVDPRTRAILEPVLLGENLANVPKDDRQFALDLGLVRHREEGGLEVANPIYREMIVRALGERTGSPSPTAGSGREVVILRA
jgi:hypothetical protein